MKTQPSFSAAAAASESTGRQLWKRPSLDQSVHQLPASHISMSLALPPNVMWTRISTTTCRLFLILSFVGNVQLKAKLPHRIYGCMLTTCNINKYREFSFHSGLLHSSRWRCPFCSGQTRRSPRYKNNLFLHIWLQGYQWICITLPDHNQHMMMMIMIVINNCFEAGNLSQILRCLTSSPKKNGSVPYLATVNTTVSWRPNCTILTDMV